ncbi:MAG: bifunctional diguanylate cyclase/phosphodiesterase [Anderseniella sp.]|jgi:diguanylate cyclase (GGDEF)-like protein|nr:bifunctional diguanylate cyclase/phosphodiesterase [Anderseniella sp.]
MSTNTAANALLICVSALLLVIGVNFARQEIGALVHEQATETAHKWATHLASSQPELVVQLSQPHSGAVNRIISDESAGGSVLSYSIYDIDGRLRTYVGPDDGAFAETAEHVSRISIPFMTGNQRVGTLVANVDSSGIYAMFVEGGSKIGMILSSAIGFIILVSLLVRANARNEAQRNIRRLMQMDKVTGLPNQLAFNDILRTLSQQEQSDHSATSLLLVNLDRFSGINERLGRANGDRLLRELAERLRTACGENVICARMTGDAFGLIATNDDNTRLEQQVQSIFAQPFKLDEQQIRLSASIGVANSANGSLSADELLQQAELALRAAKSAGGQQLVTYDSQTVNEFRETERIAAIVEDACEHNRFELHYQPVVDARSRKLASFEALIRLTSREGERIGPDRFIPIAEHIGRIDQIGLWTLREACRTVSGLPKHISMAVNLSPQQFASQTLVDDIKSILEETRVSPDRLELEVTESIMIGDTAPVLEQLRKLQQLGIRVALDDFGTGYSSLGYLWQFNFDKLKIDQAFIRASDEEPKALALLGKIVEVGRTFNMKITAEGIETEEHASRAAYLGCDYSQGYLFGKAIPQTALASVVISEFAEYIRRQTNGTAMVDMSQERREASASA